MIVNGEADVAAIDCVTFEHIRKTAPALVAAVRVLAWSQASPGLPLITATATDERTVEILRAALADVATDRVAAPALDALLIEGSTRPPPTPTNPSSPLNATPAPSDIRS
jgi:ABC-type phosphate/phosphonate transport system substrate-binding protein